MAGETPHDQLIDQTCPSCRHTVPQELEFCPKCGYQIRGGSAAASKKGAPTRSRSADQGFTRNEFGGILITLSGIVAIPTGLVSIVESGFVAQFYADLGFAFGADVFFAFGILSLIFGIVAVAGGLMAYKGRYWKLAVVGGVMGTIASGAFFLGTMLGLIGLITVAISKADFEN